MKKITLLSIFLSTILIVFSSEKAFSQQQTLENPAPLSSFQKTNKSLLYEIETNLKKYDTSKSHSEKIRIKPPKERRFEIAEKGIKKLIYKNAIPNSLYGGTIAALATTHPVGLVLGGFAGLLQGKSDRYEEAQGKIYQMKKDIFDSADHEVTLDEIRLAYYTGADLSEFYALAPTEDSLPIETSLIESITAKAKDLVPPKEPQQLPPSKTIEPELSVAAVEEVVTSTEPYIIPPPDVDYCHDLAIGNTKAIDHLTRRELVTFCFYHMN